METGLKLGLELACGLLDGEFKFYFGVLIVVEAHLAVVLIVNLRLEQSYPLLVDTRTLFTQNPLGERHRANQVRLVLDDDVYCLSVFSLNEQLGLFLLF